jgi:uncharacterized protein (TIGR00369 family)
MFMTVSTLSAELLAALEAANLASAFFQWSGMKITKASPGNIELQAPWRAEFGQFTGFMHAGILGGLIDNACGYAAATVAGKVLASHYSVNCLRPAVGERFIARARVVKPGKQQIFTACELFAVSNREEKLVATGEALFVVMAS